MPYLDANEPYNPIPGLVSGGFIGAGIAATAGYGGVKAVNATRAGRENLRTSKIKKIDQGISDMRTEALNLQEQAFEPKPYSGGRGQAPRMNNNPQGALKPGQAARNYFDLRGKISSEQQAKEELLSKKVKPKIKGGKMGLVIGGTALAGGLIGGTAGVVGNYD